MLFICDAKQSMSIAFVLCSQPPKLTSLIFFWDAKDFTRNSTVSVKTGVWWSVLFTQLNPPPLTFRQRKPNMVIYSTIILTWIQLTPQADNFIISSLIFLFAWCNEERLFLTSIKRRTFIAVVATQWGKKRPQTLVEQQKIINLRRRKKIVLFSAAIARSRIGVKVSSEPDIARPWDGFN